MTPQDLYEFIKREYPHCEVPSICYIDKSCLQNGFCTHAQSTTLIDFDRVKDDHCKGLPAKPASVDAICISGTDKVFYFIELKGWKKYLETQSKQKRSPKETAEGYKLFTKLSDSLRLCEQIVSNNELFADIPIRFLLVTDIDTKTHGIESFHSVLNLLGQTSTNIYLDCLQQARNILESEIKIEREYISCKEFDNHIKSV